MNKWIEQQSKECSEERGNIPHGQFDRECKEAFKLGAQAVLAKVKEVVEGTRGNDVDDDPLKDPLRNEGRESLRQEILEKLNAD